MNKDTVKNEKDIFFKRFWILSLLKGVEEAGCSPLTLQKFNLLIYLANAVSKCYAVKAIDSTILKVKDGPLYPEMIWELDRLVGVGMIDVSDIVVGKNNLVRNVSYSINKNGIFYHAKFKAIYDDFDDISYALHSAAMAFSRNINNLTSKNFISKDGNYANPQFSLGQVVDFGLWNNANLTADSIAFITEELSGEQPFESSVSVNIYTKYLTTLSN